jgi:uncharacterized membrane protein (UPF0127 family)
MDFSPFRGRPHKLPAHTVKDRSRGGFRLNPHPERFAAGSRTSYGIFEERQHLNALFFSPTSTTSPAAKEGARILVTNAAFWKRLAARIQRCVIHRHQSSVQSPSPGDLNAGFRYRRPYRPTRSRHLSGESVRPTFISLSLSASLALAGCASASSPWVELRGQRFTVEIADTDESRARGLMFRDSMAEDRGMLFIFDRSQPLAFWMKNTKIPLDILYFDSNRRLVSQQRDVPPCSLGNGCPPYPSSAPARYVLELNAGQAAKLGLNDGAELKFGPGIPPTP